MTLLNIIKSRTTTREYSSKKIPSKTLRSIVNAGIWGPSLVNGQPFFFVLITNRELLNGIASILSRNLKKLGIVGRSVFIPATMKSINTCQALVAVYRTGNFTNLIHKFSRYIDNAEGNKYLKMAEQAEISACSATIQNMILMSDALGVGSCWLHLPLFCEKEINRVLKLDKSLVAFLALGIPIKKGRRTPRMPEKLILRLIK